MGSKSFAGPSPSPEGRGGEGGAPGREEGGGRTRTRTSRGSQGKGGENWEEEVHTAGLRKANRIVSTASRARHRPQGWHGPCEL